MSQLDRLPVAVIGAGPIGLAAAAHLVDRGLRPLVLERGHEAGASMLEWAHVRVFSPWRYNIDEAARRLLEETGWQAPEDDAVPTGGEIVRRYLAPLAAHPAVAPHLLFRATVTGVTRKGFDKMTTAGRHAAPFVVHWRNADGSMERAEVRAVIDASGTWTQPNPLGIDGLPVPGEAEAGERIAYGIPGVLGAQRARYAGRRVLVVGSGHSAINVALDLLRLQAEEPATRILWGLRRNRIDRLLGGGLNDKLAERGALGLAAKAAIDEERLDVLAPFALERIDDVGDELLVHALHRGEAVALRTDRIVVATGFRPDPSILREVRIALDPAVEAPPALAPLIDPNLHSCGTVPPHGAAELAHPEPGLYIVGAKSYGRAPTFLMVTGYEQVRSVVAAIAGDAKAAREVRLVLPETGVCSAPSPEQASGCCGGPAPAETDVCCALDARAKAAGEDGCGCAKPSESQRALVTA